MVTLKDVSVACCISRSSASKALQDYLDISDSLRNRVRETAAVMGYIDRASARLLPEKDLFGIFITDGFQRKEGDEKIQKWKQTFKKICNDNGFETTIAQPERQTGERLVYHYFGSRFAGICILCLPEETEILYTMSQSTAAWTSCCGSAYCSCLDPSRIEICADGQEGDWKIEETAGRAAEDLLLWTARHRKRMKRAQKDAAKNALKNNEKTL